MHNIDYYIDLAKEKTGVKSDIKLGKLLGFKTSAVSYWRTGRSWPSDTTMIKLADLAGIPKEQALLELAYWRSEGETQEVYKGLIKRLTGVFVLAFFAGMLAFSSPASASAPSPENTLSFQSYTLSLYYISTRQSKSHPTHKQYGLLSGIYLVQCVHHILKRYVRNAGFR